MKPLTTILIITLLSISANAAYQKERDLTSYPTFLFDTATGEREGEYYKTIGGTFDVHFTGIIIISEIREFPETNAANYILNQLPQTKFLWLNPAGENSMIRTPQQDFDYAMKKISEIDDIKSKDSILIGMPCTNTLVQELLRINKEECGNYLKPTEGKITLQQHGTTGFYTTLIITAGSPEALFETTKKFHEAMKDTRQAKKLERKTETTFTFPQIVQIKTTETKKEIRDVKKIIQQQKTNQAKDQINKQIKKVKKILFLL